MDMPVSQELFRQHLIDPEVCIRCNTCEATCPIGAISHDSRNYVVDPNKCNYCAACIPPCPTGAIDNWRVIQRTAAYPVAEQLKWNELPAELSLDQLEALEMPAVPAALPAAQAAVAGSEQ